MNTLYKHCCFKIIIILTIHFDYFGTCTTARDVHYSRADALMSSAVISRRQGAPATERAPEIIQNPVSICYLSQNKSKFMSKASCIC